MSSLSRRLTAEMLGTCLLVATVIGSGIMAERLTGDTALALLANTLPTAAILFVLITLLGPISGAHFNPIVTVVLAVRGELGGRTAWLYALSQGLGGLLGTAIAHLMFATPVLALSQQARTGSAQWFSEAVATFGLLLVILLGQRQRTHLPALVAVYIGAAYWFTASTSFANPAVTLARAFTDSFSGIRWSDVPAFMLAQSVGGLVALAFATWLLQSPKKDAAV